MRTPKAIIVGGGIGGLAAAIALERVGVEAIVCERASDVRHFQVGAGLTIWANAVAILEQLGVRAEVQRGASAIHWQEFQSSTGRSLAKVNVGEIAETELGFDDMSLGRPEIHAALLDAVPDGCVQTDRLYTGFEQDDSSVTVRFADGSSETADILIGADGFDSTLRKQLLGPDGMRERYAGLRTWTAMVDFEHERVTPAHTLVLGPGARIVFVPCGDGRVAWGATLVWPEGAEPGGSAKEMLLDVYEGWPTPVTEMLQATPDDAIVGRDVRDREPVSRWGEGRVTLLGDAAHPMTHFLGQGACAALEDAFILARRVHAHGATADALRAYEDTRIAQSTWMVETSWRMTRPATVENRLAATLRNGFFAVTSRAVSRRLLRRAYRNLGPEVNEPLPAPAAP